MATLKQTDRALKSLVRTLDKQLTPAVQGVTATQAMAILKQRVFNQGRATDGGLIKRGYSKGWQKKRKSKGFQTSYVDLQFSGDLFKSIKVGKSGNDTVLGFTNEKTLVYARANEERYKNAEDTIFALNNKESDEAFKAAQKAFDKIVDRWLKTF